LSLVILPVSLKWRPKLMGSYRLIASFLLRRS
jgi:hypothetical protein